METVLMTAMTMIMTMFLLEGSTICISTHDGGCPVGILLRKDMTQDFDQLNTRFIDACLHDEI